MGSQIEKEVEDLRCIGNELCNISEEAVTSPDLTSVDLWVTLQPILSLLKIQTLYPISFPENFRDLALRPMPQGDNNDARRSHREQHVAGKKLVPALYQHYHS